MVQKGDACKGGKKAKERFTVLLCASATGEKLKPLVIGKANNPRCFRGINKGSLGIDYEANNKAWLKYFLTGFLGPIESLQEKTGKC